jgi:hypothetical protein
MSEDFPSLGKREFGLFCESLRFWKLGGELSACFVLTKILVSFCTTNVSIYWLKAIKLILIYYKIFIFQSGTTTTVPIWQKSQDVYLFDKSLRHCLIKTMAYALWTGLCVFPETRVSAAFFICTENDMLHFFRPRFFFRAQMSEKKNCASMNDSYCRVARCFSDIFKPKI